MHRFCFCNCIASGVLGLYNRVLGFGRFRDVQTSFSLCCWTHLNRSYVPIEGSLL